MPTYGLTPQGFNLKPLDQILTDIQQRQLQAISASLNITATALLGILNGILGQDYFELWQILGALYSGMDPDAAVDDQLTSLALITGTMRQDAKPTEVVGCVVNVNAGFNAAIHAMRASITGNPTAVFWNKAAVSNPGGVAANVNADFEAVDPGAVQALAHTLIVIAQPLAGWNTIDNPTDGAIGSPIESNSALRARRQLELALPGSTTADAIRADVLEQLPKTTSCTVLHNDTDLTDGNGVPPHSIEVIARLPGASESDDEALAQLILDSKAAGIGTHGLDSEVATDSQGNTEQIFFTRPADVALYIAITVEVDSTFPVDGITQIKNALLNYGTFEFQPGVKVRVKPLQGAVFPEPTEPDTGVIGVVDVDTFKVDTVNPPLNTANIAINIRQVGILDSARIFVTTVPAS